MSGITEMLMALGNPDPSVRVPAEQAVQQAKDTDLAGFILTVLEEFRDDGKPAFTRNMAGTLLKNAVAPSLREVAARRQLEERWKQLQDTLRAQVKREVLASLNSGNREVRNIAANIVGSLSRLELPAGKWPELMPALLSAVHSTLDQHQETALMCMGYICEEGRDNDQMEEALAPHTGGILAAVAEGMRSSDKSDVQLCATKALCDAMEYIGDNMEKKDQRDYLLEAICTVGGTCTALRTREMAMQCLVKVAELYYTTLPDYIQALHAVTTRAIKEDHESIGLQAILFWIAICETERDMKEDGNLSGCLRYAETGMAELVTICLGLLVKQDELGDPEEDWNLAVAGAKLLQVLAEAVGAPIHQPVMSFVYANIGSTEWRQREAALMAFGCILSIQDSAAQEAMQDTVAQAVPGLLNYLKDPHPFVTDTCAWVIAQVCDGGYADAFLAQSDRLQQLLNIIGPMIGGAEPRMTKRACHIIHNLALAYEDEENQATNELSAFFSDLVEVLLHAIDNGSSADLRLNAQETLNALVDAAPADCLGYVNSVVPRLHERMSYQLNLLEQLVAGKSDTMEPESALSLLCGALSSVARKLVGQFTVHLGPSMERVLRFTELMDSCVEDEALVAIGAMAHASKEAMAPFFPRVVPYILQCLRAFDEPDSIYGVVAVLGDLCLSSGQALQPYAPSIMDTLFRNLSNHAVDRDLKCSFISCFGDVILNVLGGAGFHPYMATLLPVIDEMFQASMAISIRGDPDSEEYIMSLWESTASFYSAVIQCFQKEDAPALQPYYGMMVNFAQYVCAQPSCFSETAIAALMVFGDLASVIRHAPPALRQAGKVALVTPQTRQLIQDAYKSSNFDADEKKQISWISTQLNHLERA